jgi:hypothetical protein
MELITCLSQVEQLVGAILVQMPEVGKWQRSFLVHLMPLFLIIKGRINFLQLSRYGGKAESTYRSQFEKSFDFADFNQHLITGHGSGHYVGAFDPSHISKSGKKTPQRGYFWSGCEGAAKLGLEISGLSVVDVDNHTAFHLEAIQTPNKEGLAAKNQSLLGHYAQIIIDKQKHITAFTRYVAVDAYFSKASFINPILEQTPLHIISRLRDDAVMRYLFRGEKTGKRGRPREYEGRIEVKKPDKSYFEVAFQDKDCIIYTAIVYVKALNRQVKLALTHYLKEDGSLKNVKLYFSTDVDLCAWFIVKYYQLRFQIEFIFRDANQHTGLEHCQARSENKLYFHFNAALSAISIAKIIYWLSVPKEKRAAFSMADVKTIHHNFFLMQRFFDVFQINPNKHLNDQKVKELITFGTIAA